jgi:hypothetical protein
MRSFLGMAVAAPVEVEGRAPSESAALPMVEYKVITPGYLRMLTGSVPPRPGSFPRRRWRTRRGAGE